MDSALLTTIAATGFTVAFFHAALPTHWLPFVLVARRRGWNMARTLVVTAFAGLGHVGVTALLGLGIAWFGFRLDERLGHLFGWAVAGALGATGLYFAWRQWRGGGICHHPGAGGHHIASADCGREADGHSHWEHEVADSKLAFALRGDWAVAGGLFLMLTLSPCEAFLPVYLTGAKFGWYGFGLLSGILAAGALAGMLLFTGLAYVGLDKMRLKALERWEAGVLAVLFWLLGLAVVALEP